MAASFNPIPSSIQISRMLRRPPGVSGISFKSGVSQKPPRVARADGGAIPDHPFTPVIGAINTDTPGRTDAHPTHVPAKSYVMPADIVSSIGEGNTAAGQQMLAKIFLPLQAQSGRQITLMGQSAPFGAAGAPYGASAPALKRKPMKPPPPPQPMQETPAVVAQGGVVGGKPGPGTPINISGGEFVIPPEEVERLGRGDTNRGHEILDAWVNHRRAEHIKTLKRLPGPAK